MRGGKIRKRILIFLAVSILSSCSFVNVNDSDTVITKVYVGGSLL